MGFFLPFTFACLLVGLAQIADVSGNFVCPQAGLFCDPEDCAKYYNCGADLTAHRQSCPSGLHFDKNSKTCNWISQVTCDCGGDSSTPSPPPASPPPSSPPPSSPPPSSPPPSSPPPSSPPGPGLSLPKRLVALYILLADETGSFNTPNGNWDPKLYTYQQNGFNMLLFSFIHPTEMKVPESFKKLAATRGTGADGAVPNDTLIMFVVGGYGYSISVNPWPWLTSKQAAEDMAVQVATWPDLYNCDGIDIDIETGAGDASGAGANLIHFVRKLKELKPSMIVHVPTFGYPQVAAENEVINESWNVDGSSNNLVDTTGLMVYTGTDALNWVHMYTKGASNPSSAITVNVPSQKIMLGCDGGATAAVIDKLADESIKQDLLGIMIWYASVRNGFGYGWSSNTSNRPTSQEAFVNAMTKFRTDMN